MNPSETNTNEQVNRALHEAMGKCWHELKYVDGERLAAKDALYDRCKFCNEYYNGNPDYCTNLNAAFDAQAFVLNSDPSCEAAERFVIALCKEVGIDTERWERQGLDGWKRVLISLEDAFCLINATAEQRALAVKQALGMQEVE